MGLDDINWDADFDEAMQSPAQIAFRAGTVAGETGKPKKCPREFKDHTFDWEHGWEAGLNMKASCFQTYIKDRVLFEKGYVPQHFSHAQREDAQERRSKRMARIVERFPDFPKAFEKYKRETGR